eukprot:tig00000144_g9116.t1
MGFVAGVPCVAPRAQLATTASLCSKQCAESGRAAQRRSEFVPATPIGRRISAAVRFEQSASRGVVFDARGITMAARASSSTDGKKKILFVCLGNICRSPAAEAVFTHMVKERGLEEKYEIDSCGTGSWHIGKPPDTRMLAELKKAGIPAEHLRARQFSGRDFERFDLILVADDSNRRAVLNQDRDGRHAAKARPAPLRLCPAPPHPTPAPPLRRVPPRPPPSPGADSFPLRHPRRPLSAPAPAFPPRPAPPRPAPPRPARPAPPRPAPPRPALPLRRPAPPHHCLSTPPLRASPPLTGAAGEDDYEGGFDYVLDLMRDMSEGLLSDLERS